MGHDLIRLNGFCPPPPPLDGTHFNTNILVSDKANIPPSCHAQRMSCLHCELAEILEQIRPPDAELIDLIEQAYLEAQIDSQSADLAYTYLWLDAGEDHCMNVQ